MRNRWACRGKFLGIFFFLRRSFRQFIKILLDMMCCFNLRLSLLIWLTQRIIHIIYKWLFYSYDMAPVNKVCRCVFLSLRYYLRLKYLVFMIFYLNSWDIWFGFSFFLWGTVTIGTWNFNRKVSNYCDCRLPWCYWCSVFMLKQTFTIVLFQLCTWRIFLFIFDFACIHKWAWNCLPAVP